MCKIVLSPKGELLFNEQKNSKMDFNRCSRCSGFLWFQVLQMLRPIQLKPVILYQLLLTKKNTTLEKLVELNKIADPNHIRVGQILELGNSAKTSETSVAATATPVNNYAAPAATANSAATSGGLVLSNGNTAGATGSYAASRMAEMTGVPASTWEAIIARESNGQVDAYNPSGASGLFQTMPGWGSTATVDDQIQSAYSAYSAQGLSAWGY